MTNNITYKETDGVSIISYNGRIVLGTDDFTTTARRLYAAAGFSLVSSQTEVAFGQESVAEDWSLDLRP